MTLEPYESFYDRLDALPDTVWFEASEPSEDERVYGYDDEGDEHDAR